MSSGDQRSVGDSVLAGVTVSFGIAMSLWAGVLAGRGHIGDAVLPAAVLLMLGVGMIWTALRAAAPLRGGLRTGAGVAVAIVAPLVAAAGQIRDVGDPEVDIARNTAIARELPLPPGSRRLDTRQSPFSQDESGDVKGYTTVTRFRVPGSLDGKGFVAFYRRAMPPRMETG